MSAIGEGWRRGRVSAAIDAGFGTRADPRTGLREWLERL